ncbi:MAG: LLM class flavin-dependent oxidoreductase [Pseudomonadales bacterium]|nr:LLM class flavin-dependent oxidoreductase [Pseudomonadales bacterium]NIX07829.1 LLM class flavin-dependent oxidoreductase [Pseudomonadales bacterium]
MHVGFAPVFQNLGKPVPDHQVYAQELAMARAAEPMGFDSVWSVEHHFTDYTMVPDVTQFLSYMAACTERVRLGSMVIVLPWHDPVRLAEEIAMLDALSGGRMILGIGRGLGRVEFDGFRVPMDESRERFVESATMILEGLERGFVELDGKHFQQPRRDIRPAPFKTFRGRTFAAAVSPDSMPVMAQLGVGLLVIPQKPWESVRTDFEVYHQVWAETHGAQSAPPDPMCGGFFFVDESADRAEEMAYKYIGRYYHSVMDHYELRVGHLEGTKGYEFYEKIHEHIGSRSDDGAARDFVRLMPFGTPQQVIEKIEFIHETIGAKGVMTHFAYGGMDYAEANRNMRLFADEVMPELQRVGEQRGALAVA